MQSPRETAALINRNLIFNFLLHRRNAFESVLFLFFEHPYDVGDMVYFNGDSARVKRISLLYTDFVK